MSHQHYLVSSHSLPHPTNDPTNMLVLKAQGAGSAGLVAVAQPAPCLEYYFPNTPTRILRLPEVIARVGLGRASIYQYMANGIFPKSISLGPRAVGWLESEVEAWLTERIRLARI